MKWVLTLLLFCFIAVGTSHAQATDAVPNCPWIPGADGSCPTEESVSEEEENAIERHDSQALSQEFYCNVVNMIRGDWGSVAGLLLVLAAVWLFLTQKMVPAILVGILGFILTWTPDLFVAGLNMLAQWDDSAQGGDFFNTEDARGGEEVGLTSIRCP